MNASAPVGPADPLPTAPHVGREAARAAAELLPDGLITVGADGVIDSANRRALRLLRRRPEDMIGRPAATALELLDFEGRDYWACSDPFGGLSIRSGHRERLLITHSGIEVLVTAQYVRAGRGLPVQAVTLSLRGAEGRRRAEADQAQVISTVAHELRSPLTSVKGFTTTLLRRWDQLGDHQKKLMLEAIQVDAGRLAQLIRELLDVSRIDAGRLSVHRIPVDPGDVLAAMTARVLVNHSGPPELTTFVARGTPAVWADPDRLDQILCNLVENGLRYADGRVHLVAEPGGDGGVVLRVWDDGPGIAPEHRQVVFNRFWVRDDRSQYGLGLYIVKGLVEAHGGRIDVQDSPMGGAGFTIHLPGPSSEELPEQTVARVSEARP